MTLRRLQAAFHPPYGVPEQNETGTSKVSLSLNELGRLNEGTTGKPVQSNHKRLQFFMHLGMGCEELFCGPLNVDGNSIDLVGNLIQDADEGIAVHAFNVVPPAHVGEAAEDQEGGDDFTARWNGLHGCGRLAAAELIQTRDDLSRTRLADQVRRARRAGKNRQLQSGGVLTMAQGRHIVAEKGLGEVAAAIAAKKRAADAIEKATKEVFKAAAKKARSWYMTNKLPAAYVVTSERSGRRLKRF
ncbi:hypothetical protein CSOJ01_16018 [Colletotrichum sojae]|uniref:Uncharacterized protein n=1 Tax=Colletotrichum sojae TaxID=2175907 RepID=A0A8H6IKK4_9PEZI|nr:hypothetical protein CSOJ01_16018 [Colletotrichum sojae]